MTTDTSAYVHFPWCLKKCPYCDFATRKIDRPDVPHAAYADAVIRELDARRPALAGRRLASVFFGGGTPSLWHAAEIGRVLAAIRGAFDGEAESLEVTVECNPSSLDRGGAAALREVGVNRLSVGVQSLSEEKLRFLGRFHDAAGGLRALEHALAEMGRVSIDLMFGLPGQRWEDLRTEVGRLLDLGVRHLSAYALTIEPGTQFGELHRKGRLAVASDGHYTEMFLGLESLLGEAGLAHYEVSNYATPGERSIHNLHYWRGRPYLGLGAAAVGCFEGVSGRGRRYRNQPEGMAYLEATDGAREVFEESLEPEDLVREALMLGLRTDEGMDVEETRTRVGIDPLAGCAAALERRLVAGDLELDDRFLRVPRDRWLRLDGIVADLF